MFSYTGGIVLFAAMLHASWNAMLHGNRDRFLSMTWMSVAIALHGRRGRSGLSGALT